MVHDLLEEVAYELERVSESFAMPMPKYEEKLRNLASEVLEYRHNIISALDDLQKADKIIWDAQPSNGFAAYSNIVNATDLLLGIKR